MRFDQLDSRSSQLARTNRSRVTALVVALLLVILGIQLAADPGTWSWMFPAAPDAAGPTILDPEAASYPLVIAEPAPANSESRSEATSSTGPLLEGIDFSSIEDNTLGLRATELDAYRTSLDRLRNIPSETLGEFAERTPNFGAVMLEPDHYRGHVFEIQGLARRILRLPADEEGAPPLYELWVFTRDSGINPWRVVAADIPDALPRGLHSEGIPVRLTGLFFKLQAYETQKHVPHIAPLLLAKTVGYRPPAAPSSAASVNPAPWIISAIIVGAIGLVIMLWRVRRSDARFEQQLLKRYAKANDDASEPAVDPATFLENLSGTPLPDDSPAPNVDHQDQNLPRP